MKKILVFLLVYFGTFLMLQAQTFNWANGQREPGSNYGTYFKTDADGNLYTCGDFTTSVTLDGTGNGGEKLAALASGPNSYIAKYSKEGKLLWAKAYNVAGLTTRTSNVDVAEDGTVYLFGYYGNTLGADMSSYVVKYTANGSKIWEKTYGNGVTQLRYAVIKGSDIYMGGNYYNSNVDISPANGNQAVTGGGSSSQVCTYVAKLDTALNLIWSQYIGYQANFIRLVIDPNGIPYCLQNVSYTLQVDKMNPNTGNRITYATFPNGYRPEGLPALVFDDDGYLYLGLTYTQTIDVNPDAAVTNNISANGNKFDYAVIKMDDGFAYLSSVKTNSAIDEYLHDMQMGPNGMLYISGGYKGAASLSLDGNTTSVTAFGDMDGFVAKYSKSNFSRQWIKTFGGSSYDLAGRICVTADSVIYLNGVYSAACNFDTDGSFYLQNPSSASEMFVSRWTPSCSSSVVYQPALSATSCMDETIEFNYGVTGSNKTYQWYKNGLPIAGATNYNYSVLIKSSNIGDYHCQVNTSCGSYTSNVLSVGLPNAVNNAQLTNGLVVYLPFNGNVTDKSTNNLTITAYGNPTYATDHLGRTQGAIGFDAIDDYLKLPAGTYFNGGSYTVSAWIYPRSSSAYPRIFDFGNGSPSDNVVWVSSNNGNGKDAFFTFNGAATSQFSATSALPLNTWSLITVTYDGSYLRIYRNGLLNATGTIASPSNVLRNFCYIAKSNWSSDVLSYMRLDEFRIYNRAISPIEITALFNFIEFTAQPASYAFCGSGNPVKLAASVTGVSNTYAWYKDGVMLSVNNDTLDIPTPGLNDNGSYQLKAYSGCYVAESEEALVNSSSTAPVVSGLSLSAVQFCANASQNVVVADLDGAVYNWYNSSRALVATTTVNHLELNSTHFVGSDSLFVVVENACGTDTSVTIPVTVYPAVEINVANNNQYYCEGLEANVSVNITNQTNVEWYLNDQAITSTTDSSVFYNTISSAGAGIYKVVASNSCGSDSVLFAVSLHSKPYFTYSPANGVTAQSNDTLYTCTGSAMFFQVAADMEVSAVRLYRKEALGDVQVAVCGSGCTQLILGGNEPDGEYYFEYLTTNCSYQLESFKKVSYYNFVSGSVSVLTNSDICLDGTPIVAVADSYTSTYPTIPHTYTWTVTDNGNNVVVTDYNDTLNFVPANTGAYNIGIRVSNGCVASAGNQAYITVRLNNYFIVAEEQVESFCPGSYVCIKASTGSEVGPDVYLNGVLQNGNYCPNGGGVKVYPQSDQDLLVVTFNSGVLSCVSGQSVLYDTVSLVQLSTPAEPLIADNFGTLYVVNSTYSTYSWYNLSGSLVSTNSSFAPTVSDQYYVVVGNSGCEATSQNYSFVYTSLKNTGSLNPSVVFPNPTTGNVFVRSAYVVSGTIVLADITGKVLAEFHPKSLETEIEMNWLQAGTYLIKMINEDGTMQICKVAKQ